MDNQYGQISDYIRQQLSQGVSEQDLRTHLRNYGWSPDAIDQAFSQARGTQAGVNPLIPQNLPRTAEPAQSAHSTQPTQPASAKEWKRPKLPKKPLLIMAGILGAGLLVVGLVLALTPFGATPALQRNAENTARRNDVAKLASGVSVYIDANNGQVPESTKAGDAEGELLLCGKDCQGGGSVPVRLEQYKNPASSVRFRQYEKNLSVPNADTVYIVPDATCNGDENGLGSKVDVGSGLAVAFLYATDGGSKRESKCMAL